MVRLPKAHRRKIRTTPEQEFIKELPDHFADDLGDVFGRVLALSMTLAHPAFEKAISGFANDGRVYLVYPESESTPLSRRRGGIKMSEPDAIAIARAGLSGGRLRSSPRPASQRHLSRVSCDRAPTAGSR